MAGSSTTVLTACVLATLTACLQDGLEDEVRLQPLDWNYFRCEVEPVLLKRCAFAACHGSRDRPLRLYAPHRLRANSARVLRAGQLSDEEHLANFDMAQAFAREVDGTVLLLRKPLATVADGYFHLGADLFAGGDSFMSTSEPSYQVLSAWTLDQTASEDCVQTEGPGL